MVLCNDGIFCRTGGADDVLSDLKKLLICVNEMEQAKPNEKESGLYLKKNKNEGESIRSAALLDLSESDGSDDDSNVLGKNAVRSVHSGGALLFGDEMSLAEEQQMDDQLIREHEESLSRAGQSVVDNPSTSGNVPLQV